MTVRAALSLFGFLVVAVCIPGMWGVMSFDENKSGFWAYVLYCTFLMVVWNVLLFGTDFIAR